MFGRGKRSHRDFGEELQAHLRLEADRLRETGMSEEEALAAARRNVGNMTRIQERFYEAHRWLWLNDLFQDVRYGLRQSRRNAGFTAVAIVTLALGIGANTGIFSLVDTVLLKTLPVKNPQRLVIIKLPDPRGGYNGIPYPTFEYFSNHNRVLSGIFASSIPEHLDMTINGRAELVNGQIVSGGYYSALGVNAVIGRTITPDDDAPGAPPVAMISYEYWKQRFGANPDVIGKSIEINGAPFTVIGVTPPGFFGLMAGFSPEVTASINMLSLLMGDGTLLNDRSTWGVEMVGGRLKPGVTLEQARADLGLLFSQTLKTAQQRKEMRIEVAPGSRGLPVVRKHFAAPLVILMVAVGLVLLIACANVANLLLARGAVRRKEIAMRLALGARRTRLVRQLLTESVLLATLGGAVGLAFAVWVTHFLLAVISSAGLPLSLSAPLDGRVLGFTALVALATGVLFGLVPAIRTTQVSLTPDLNAGPGLAGGTRGKLGLGRGLVVSQIAGSLLLMVGVGLFVRTLWDLQDVHPGFNVENVLLFTVEPHLVGYKGARLTNLYKELLENIQGLPGVRSVSASRLAPFTPAGPDATISISSHAPLPDENRTVQESFVGPNFFQAMGMPLLLGRRFSFQDAEGGPRVAVINQTAALRYFGNRNPIGVRFNLSQRKGPIQVIGVVKDAKYYSLREAATAMVFLPLFQFSPDAQRVTFEVRTAVSPRSMVAAARHRIEATDRNLPMMDVKTLTEQIDQSLMPVRLIATLSSLFALLALLLACVGLYGIMAYAVERRTHEIGIRMALGAEKRDVLRLVVGQGTFLTLTGVGIGLLGALGLMKFLSSLLYGVKPTDPLTFIAASLILVAVGLLACYAPARRATKVDPMVALRYE
jgi:macrolide transport system ATP-binding/permease protein